MSLLMTCQQLPLGGIPNFVTPKCISRAPVLTMQVGALHELTMGREQSEFAFNHLRTAVPKSGACHKFLACNVHAPHQFTAHSQAL